MENELIKPQGLVKNANRRQFLRVGTMTVAGAGLLLIGCNDDKDIMPEGMVSLGSGDTGILNYAYALEQLEAAFYAEVLRGSYFTNASAEEKTIMGDLEKHERAHREFFKAALGTSAIGPLEFNFTAIDFNSRTSVLGAAKTFEDLGVAAYNGAGQHLESADLLLIAGKIVSVEARHAAAIRDLINPGTADFAGNDIIDANGLERTLNFTQVLTAAGTFVRTKIDFSKLPS
ncbi:Ferritin-like domain-containing protein [Algoriphagus alkaliphilus]|uniref:Ferritin-like domain-containing protein n=1 Tax=Algoriphagus alkaliphilus TaxID=279824 RepID=A0A1G5WZU5_9BACT|nr:ferritin-like domain-containing protein [Algoriphagus alkaliphilus]MBA4301864.1 Tat (twin-arginine translocation) pathway signal sequence containing protein [Cyclobacterium sp.]SDA63196.1 Ferritin-like domain-containing protein [Algoriphagus alkaliphilus]